MIMLSSNRLKNGLVVMRLLPAYVLLGVVKHFMPLRWLARWAWSSATSARDPATERRLAASVIRLSYLTGLPDRDCLQRSLLLYRVLSRAGADPTLVIGLDRMNGRIQGHAWVIVDGDTVTENKADLLRFSPILAFGMRGALLPAPPDPHAA